MAKAGKKPITVDQLRSDWKEVMEELGKAGKTRTHIANELTISLDTVSALAKRDDEFNEELEKFSRLAAAYWMDIGQDLAEGTSRGSTNAWKYNMANRVGWSDKVTTETNTHVTMDETATDVFQHIINSQKNSSEDKSEEEK